MLDAQETRSDIAEITALDFTNAQLRSPVSMQRAPVFVDNDKLGLLSGLVGTWTNQALPNTSRGGRENPFSYSLMPVPQAIHPAGYILKNFSYYEEITFFVANAHASQSVSPSTSPSTIDSSPASNTLHYQQRVYFADGPNRNGLVYVESGAFISLSDQASNALDANNGANDALVNLGSSSEGVESDSDVNPTVPTSISPIQQLNIAKQLSAPYCDSILAVGYAAKHTGAPTIRAPHEVWPQDVNLSQYKMLSMGNLNLDYTANPNKPLAEALEVARPTDYVQINLDSYLGGGGVSCSEFDNNQTHVTRHRASLWLESFDDSPVFTQLQYSQTTFLSFVVKGEVVSFPRLSANTLRRKV